MQDPRQRLPLQPSHSFVATPDTDAARSLKRRHTSPVVGDLPLSTSLMTSFQHESHYPDPAIYAKHALTTRAVSRNGTLVAQLPSMDPTPGDNDAIFLHPPFSDFPDAHKHREGLTYAVLAVNPDWFLDATDYQQLNGENSSGVRYPAQLEPPRGWCPAKKKEAKESWAEGEEPRLRCTFCRRTYAGVNAKSMWRRHVFEKHKIAMSNRRENQERKGRGSNKENKEDVPRVSERASARGAAKVQLETDPPRPSKLKYRLRTTEDWGKPYASLRRAHSLPQPQEVSDDDEDDSPGTLSQVPAKESDLAAADVFQVGASTTPPLTPGLSPSSSNPQSRLLDLSRSIAESPYDPLLTPAFRHSPARLPSDQPWRFPSPSHPLHGNAREMSLNMLAHIDSSPMLRGLDLSPIVRMSTKEHFKPSIFSSPLSSLMKSNVGASGGGDPSKSSSKPSPRCLFSSGVPTPLVDRFKLKHRIPESPFGREFTPIKPRAFASLTQVTGGAWRSMFTPSKSPGKGLGLLDPIDLEGEDPFTDPYKPWLSTPAIGNVEGRPASPPESSPELDSPVLRSSQLSSSQMSAGESSLAISTRDSVSTAASGIGAGLLEGFSLRDAVNCSASSSEDEQDHSLMFVKHGRSINLSSRKGLRLGVSNDGSPLPPVVTGKKSRRRFLQDAILDGDGDCEMQEPSQPKKRRKTVSGCD